MRRLLSIRGGFCIYVVRRRTSSNRKHIIIVYVLSERQSSNRKTYALHTNNILTPHHANCCCCWLCDRTLCAMRGQHMWPNVITTCFPLSSFLSLPSCGRCRCTRWSRNNGKSTAKRVLMSCLRVSLCSRRVNQCFCDLTNPSGHTTLLALRAITTHGRPMVTAQEHG